MSRESALARGRVAAELGMADACTIRRRSAESTDDFSGRITPTYEVIYAGKCRFQQHQATADRREVGEDDVLLLKIELQLPMSAIGFQAHDEVTCDASRDADLTGKVFLIHDLAHKTDATARRMQIEERTG